MIDFAKLQIQVDSTQASQSAANLDKLGASSESAEAQTKKLTAATEALVKAQKEGQALSSAMIRDVGGWAEAQKILEKATRDAAKAAKDGGDATKSAANEAVAFDSKVMSGLRSRMALTKQMFDMEASATAEMTRRSQDALNFRMRMNKLRSESEAKTAQEVAKAAADEAKAMESLAARTDKLRAALDPHLRVQQQLAARQRELNELVKAGSIDQAEHSRLMGLATKEAKHAENALGGVAFASSTAAREILVIGRELSRGDFTRMAGSATILAQALGGMKYMMNPIVLGIVAIGAATVGAVYAISKFEEHIRSLSNVADGLGRAYGLTGEQLERVSHEGAAAARISVKAAEEQASAYAKTGKIGADVMEGLISISKRYAMASGVEAKVATDKLAESFADPSKGAADLNEQFHFLNSSQLEYIVTLDKSGQRLKAQEELYRLLVPALSTTQTKVDGLAGAMKNLALWSSNAGRATLEFFAETDKRNLDQKISDAQKRVNLAKSSGPIFAGFGELKDAQKELADLQRQAADMQRNQKAARESILTTAGSRIASQIRTDTGDLRDLQEKQRVLYASLHSGAKLSQTDLKDQYDAYQAVSRAIDTFIPKAEKEHRIAELQRQIGATRDRAEKGRLTTLLQQTRLAGEVITKEEAAAKATDAGNIVADRAMRTGLSRAESLRREAESMEAAADAAVKLASAYLAGDSAALAAEIRKKSVTDATRRGVDAEAQYSRQLQLTIAEDTASAAKLVRNNENKAAAQRVLNENVESGRYGYEEALRMMQEEEAIRPLLVLQTLADAEGKKQLQVVIDRLRNSMRSLNETAVEAKILQDTSGLDNEIEQTQLRMRLIGATNRERAVELAQLRALQTLRKNGGLGADDRPNSLAGVEFVTKSRSAAASASDADFAAGKADREAQNFLRSIDQIRLAADGMGASLEGAFGKAATGSLRLVSLMADQARAQSDINNRRRKELENFSGDEKERFEVEKRYSSEAKVSQLRNYADMAGAAKSMFNEKTAAYRVLEGVERAYRTVELAMSLKSMAQKAIETVFHVGQEGTKATASGIAAYASAMASLPFPLNLAAGAATLAALAAVGISIAGGGKASNVGQDDMKTRQDRQGTGSVLGSKDAKSDSIAASLEIVASNSNRMLEYGNDQLKALRDINKSIGSMAASISRSMTVSGGAFDTSALGLGVTRKGPGLFGSKTSTVLQDQGLQFASQDLASLLSGGVNAQSYQQTASTTTKKFLGLKYGTKTSLNTSNGDLEEGLKSQLTLLVGSLRDGVVGAAAQLGIEGARATLDSFQVNLGKLSFKDMTGEEIEKALNAVFSELADDMASSIVPSLSQFQKVGEGTFETLERVARSYTVVDVTLKSIGMSFGAVGVSSISARERLVDLAGGLDEFANRASFFQENFLTDAEQMAPIISSVTKEMARLGASSVDTLEEFKSLVLGLDLSTEAGSAMYSALMAVAPAFLKVTEYASGAGSAIDFANKKRQLEIELLKAQGNTAAATAAERADLLKSTPDALKYLQQAIFDALDAQELASKAAQAAEAANDAVDKARSTLTTAYEREKSALEGVVNKFEAMSKSLAKFLKQLYLGPQAALSPEEQYLAARSEFQRVSALANSGDEEALGELQSVSEQYLEASKSYYASSKEYFADLAAVRAATASAQKYAEQQVNVAAKQLELLTKSVDGLLLVNNSVVSVKDAITALKSAILAATAANDNANGKASQSTIDYAVKSKDASYLVKDGKFEGYTKAELYSWTTTPSEMPAGKYQAYQTLQYLKDAGYNVPGFALGGVFTNGIVSRPSRINMADIGEGGNPEAIMPLVYGPKGLGVRAAVPENVAPANDPEVKQLLNRILEALEGGNMQRGAAATETLQGLNSLGAVFERNTRAIRQAGAK